MSACRHPKWKRLSARDIAILTGGYPPDKGITACACGAIFDARKEKP